MKNWIYLIILFLLVACKGQQEDRNAISFEDLAGETGEQEKDSLFVTNTSAVELNSAYDYFVHFQLLNFDTISHTEFHPIDRFTFSQRKKIEFKSKTDVQYGDVNVTPRADFYYYTFSDTTKTKNAFYNWLDCFGSDCQMIKINEDMQDLKTPPSFSLVFDTTIVIVNYRCEDKKFSWKPLEDSIISRFGKDYDYRLNVDCGGPLKWR